MANKTLELFGGLPKLHNLDLSGCEGSAVTDTGLKHIGRQTTLRCLRLDHCRNVTDCGSKHLCCLAALQDLNLDQCCNLTDAGLEILGLLTALQRLCLIGCCKLTDKGVEHLSSPTALQTLRLDRCPVGTEVERRIVFAAPADAWLHLCRHQIDMDTCGS